MAFFQELIQCLFTGKSPFANTLKHLNSQASQHHWGNLGYWQGSDDYAGAAQALADELVHGVNMQQAKPILMLGCGHGEELSHWAKSGFYNRDSAIYGVDLDKAAIKVATECNPEAHFWMGSAQQYLQHAKGIELSFDGILALDCAYHFDHKFHTWQLAYERLSPQGLLAISDLVLVDNITLGFKQKLWLKLASLVFSIPYENWISSKQYEQRLESMGFKIQRSQLCGAEVLDGFYQFTQGPLFNDSAFNKVPKSWMLKSKITGYLIKKLRDRNLIDYQLIQAAKV